MKVYLATLGCKLNESELEGWARQFASGRVEVVDDPRQADLCVLNTCTVTHIAARKSRQIARQVARDNPQARVILTGCYASTAPEEAARLPNVALVVPNADKDELVRLAGQLLGDALYQTTETGCRLPEAASGLVQATGVGQQTPDEKRHTTEDREQKAAGGEGTSRLKEGGLWMPDGGKSRSASPSPQLRTRSFVKIMDGCNMSCTYCIIPLARGKERSRPLSEIVDEVKTLVADGFKEIILTGVQISVFENIHDKLHGLRDLVAAILGETGVPRLRLTSIAPWDLDESLLDLWSDPRLCRHVHLSLQSGCDTVLRRMRRPYTSEQFSRAVRLTRERIPDVGVTTDVIVGFPGESDVEFEMSLQFVESMQFSRVHVFPYSAREGTVAARLPLQVAEAIKRARVTEMQAVAEASARAFIRHFIGRTMDVLWETGEPTANRSGNVGGESGDRGRPALIWSGYTDNYVRVLSESTANLHNQIAPVRLTRVEDDAAMGEWALGDEGLAPAK